MAGAGLAIPPNGDGFDGALLLCPKGEADGAPIPPKVDLMGVEVCAFPNGDGALVCPDIDPKVEALCG